MRTLNRNKSTFYASYYLGNVEVVDENGFYTGERVSEYTGPEEKSGNISPASGSVIQEVFGTNISYDKVIALDDDLGIDENTHLWVDKTPEDGEYDYVVKRVATSLNSVLIAISKVDVRQ